MAEVLRQTEDEMVFGVPPATRRVSAVFGGVLLAMALAWPIYLGVQWLRVALLFGRADGVIVGSLSEKRQYKGMEADSTLAALGTRIRYTFEVDGRAYSNTRIAPGLNRSGPGLVRRYPRGLHTTVYYSKREPSEAYLEPFTAASAGFDIEHALSGLVLVLLAVGGVMLLRTGPLPDELELHFDSRTYRRRRRGVFRSRSMESRFDDFKGLRFQRETRGTGRSTQNILTVYLRWHSGEECSLGWWQDQGEASAALADLLQRLDLPVIDPDTDQEVIRRPEALAPTLRARADIDRAEGLATSQAPTLPPNLGIRYEMCDDTWKFMLPPFMRLKTRLISAVVFLAFFAALEAGGAKTEARAQRVCLIMQAICVAAASGAVLFGGLREEVTAGPKCIEVTKVNMRRPFRRRSIPCHQIKGIWFDGIEVIVRSNSEVMRIDAAGRARPCDKRWLADALRAVVTASRPGRDGDPLKLPTQH